MKQRLISAAYGIALALVILAFYKTIVLNIALCFICLLAVYEVFNATGTLKHTGMFAVCMAFAAAAPFLGFFPLQNAVAIAGFIFITLLFTVMLRSHSVLRLDQMALCFMLTLLSSLSISCIVYMRDEHLSGNALRDSALFYIVLVFVGAWITDAGGYFVGRFLGRHKLSPVISPKKTVEGAVGGIALTLLLFVAASLIYQFYLHQNGTEAVINYIPLLLLALLCAVVSILGDLSASLVKRENNVKDFGNILPGHGGVLDRFDSILFVAPLIFIFVRYIPLIS